MSNILDELKAMITSEIISKAASTLGESESGVTKAVGGLIPTILGGLLQKSSDRTGFGNIFNMLSDSRNLGFLDNLGSLIGGGNLAQGDPKDIAGNLMGQLFGNKTGGILDAISSFAGVKKSTSSSLLGLAGPLVMGFLGRKIKNEGLNAAGLISLLTGQKNNIMSALPGGIGNMLGLSSIPSIEAPKTGGNKWLPWLLGLLALAALIYLWRGCNKSPVDEVSNVVEQTKETVSDAVQDAAETATDAVSSLGDFFKKKLACGVELNIPSNGIESQVVSFIEDASRPVDKTTWFNFDRLTFETGSANLDMAKSSEQLNNIAEIMKCYKNVKIKIGGYTDNTGNAAANMKLSSDRAANVKAELIKLGVDAARMESEGYGDQHAVASNDTEEGRAQNRRIALRVTQK